MVEFAVLVDHRVKLKESEKEVKYLEISSGLKKLWNMKVTIITIVVGAKTLADMRTLLFPQTLMW